MCFNETSSWISFTIGIVGTAVNLFFFRDPSQLTTNLFWVQAAFMQLVDALLYRGLPCKILSKIGNFINLIHPVLPAIMVQFIAPGPWSVLAIAMVVSYGIYSVQHNLTQGCLIDSEGKVDLNYWDRVGSTLYSFACCLTFLAMPKYACHNIITFLALMALSNFGKTIGRSGSVWCFAASFAPLIFMILFSYDAIRPK